MVLQFRWLGLQKFMIPFSIQLSYDWLNGLRNQLHYVGTFVDHNLYAMLKKMHWNFCSVCIQEEIFEIFGRPPHTWCLKNYIATVQNSLISQHCRNLHIKYLYSVCKQGYRYIHNLSQAPARPCILIHFRLNQSFLCKLCLLLPPSHFDDQFNSERKHRSNTVRKLPYHHIKTPPLLICEFFLRKASRLERTQLARLLENLASQKQAKPFKSVPWPIPRWNPPAVTFCLRWFSQQLPTWELVGKAIFQELARKLCDGPKVNLW